jgi:flagellar basal body rod protein FlgB
MVLFILFPGFASSKVWWNYRYNNGKPSKITFLDDLKKIGDVYTYTPNIYKYYKDEKLEDKFTEKPENISLEQFDIDKECKKIYEEVKSYKGKFIPIGHSAGGWFAYYFTKLYPKKCKKLILIESHLLPEFESVLHNKNYPKITIQQLQKIIDNIKTKKNNRKYIDELINITLYKYSLYTNKFNGKLSVPTLSFENVITPEDKKWKLEHNDKNIVKYEKEMKKINKNKIHFINLINTEHFPWEIPEYSDEMIRQIKYFVI